MDVSKRLIELRELYGYTQNGLAERAGVSQTHLRRVELGQADITVGHLQLLCDAMGISLQDFLPKQQIQTKQHWHYQSVLRNRKHYCSRFLRAYDRSILRQRSFGRVTPPSRMLRERPRLNGDEGSLSRVKNNEQYEGRPLPE